VPPARVVGGTGGGIPAQAASEEAHDSATRGRIVRLAIPLAVAQVLLALIPASLLQLGRIVRPKT